MVKNIFFFKLGCETIITRSASQTGGKSTKENE